MGKLLNIKWRSNEGRNGWDPTENIPEDMSEESLNVSLRAGQLGIKRRAASRVDTTGNTFTGANAMFRFLQNSTDTTGALLIIDNQTPFEIVKWVTGTISLALSLVDPITGEPYNATAACLNSKVFLALKTGTNRIYVFAPNESATAVRRQGLAPLGAPTVANHGGGGAYPNTTPRWYATALKVKSSSTVLRQSELTAGVAFTPNGTSDSVRITRGSTPGEGETHWQPYGSVVSADGPWYPLGSDIAIATSTYDDTQDPNTYNANGDAAPVAGSHYPFPAVRFLKSDGKRLVGFGVWDTSVAAGASIAPDPGTVYITPVLQSSFGSNTGSDDERFQAEADQVDRVFLGVASDGVDAGLSDLCNNTIYAFQNPRGIYALTPTLNSQTPYTSQKIDSSRGGLNHKSIVVAPDATGKACCYFLNPEDGPNRIVLGNSIEWLGKDCADLWPTVDQKAIIVSHAYYDARMKEVVWHLAGSGNSGAPNFAIVYNVMLGRIEVRGQSVRYGWAQWSGLATQAVCSVMTVPGGGGTQENTSLGKSSMYPYLGYLSPSPTYVLRLDGGSTTDGGTTGIQALVRSGALWEFGSRLYRRVFDAYLTAKAGAATIRETIYRNFSRDNFPDDISLVAEASEKRVVRRSQAIDVAECNVAQVQLGDTTASSSQWELDRWDATSEETAGAPNP